MEIPTLEKFMGKIETLPPIISSVVSLQLSVGKLQLSAPPKLFTPRRNNDYLCVGFILLNPETVSRIASSCDNRIGIGKTNRSLV